MEESDACVDADDNLPWSKQSKQVKDWLCAKRQLGFRFVVDATNGFAIGILSDAPSLLNGLPMIDADGKTTVGTPKTFWILTDSKSRYESGLSALKAHRAQQAAEVAEKQRQDKIFAKNAEKKKQLEESLSKHGNAIGNRAKHGHCEECQGRIDAVLTGLGGHMGSRRRLLCLKCDANEFFAFGNRVMCDECSAQLERCKICHISFV